MGDFLLLNCANIPIFTVSFENQQKLAKHGPQNDNFSHFAKHRLLKEKPLCCTPPPPTKNGVFQLASLKKNIEVEQKTNLKSGKTKIRKGDLKETIREETPEKRKD